MSLRRQPPRAARGAECKAKAPTQHLFYSTHQPRRVQVRSASLAGLLCAGCTRGRVSQLRACATDARRGARVLGLLRARIHCPAPHDTNPPPARAGALTLRSRIHRRAMPTRSPPRPWQDVQDRLPLRAAVLHQSRDRDGRALRRLHGHVVRRGARGARARCSCARLRAGCSSARLVRTHCLRAPVDAPPSPRAGPSTWRPSARP